MYLFDLTKINCSIYLIVKSLYHIDNSLKTIDRKKEKLYVYICLNSKSKTN